MGDNRIMKAFDVTVFKPVICELIRYYYEVLDNPTGGWCHIVLDGGNLDDTSLLHCQDSCGSNGDDLGFLIMAILNWGFTEEEREEMYKTEWGMARPSKLNYGRYW